LIYEKKFGPESLSEGFIKRQFPQDTGEKSSEPGRDSNGMPPGAPAINGLKGHLRETILSREQDLRGKYRGKSFLLCISCILFFYYMQGK
jgi:hypothetical protein